LNRAGANYFFPFYLISSFFLFILSSNTIIFDPFLGGCWPKDLKFVHVHVHVQAIPGTAVNANCTPDVIPEDGDAVCRCDVTNPYGPDVTTSVRWDGEGAGELLQLTKVTRKQDGERHVCFVVWLLGDGRNITESVHVNLRVECNRIIHAI
jgi:hypothetical protein